MITIMATGCMYSIRISAFPASDYDTLSVGWWLVIFGLAEMMPLISDWSVG